MTNVQEWIDKDPQRCSWCPEPAYGHAVHNDYKLHPSCGRINHGNAWAPRAWDRLPKALKALQAVLDLHKPSQYGGCTHAACDSGSAWPCPTVETIQDAIGEDQS